MSRRWLRNVGGHPNETGFRPGLIRTRMPPASVGQRRSPTLLNDQSTLNATTISIDCPAGGSITIAWGDGTTTAVTCDGTLQASVHNYAATGQYTILVLGTVERITDFRCYNQVWISGDLSSAIAGLGPNLVNLFLFNTGATGDVAALAACTSIVNLYLYNTGVTGDVAALAACTSLVNLRLHSTGVTGDVAALAACTSLVTLYLYATGVTYTGPTVLPAWGGTIMLDSCTSLLTTMVDQFIIDFDGVAAAAGDRVLDLGGTTPPRTAASTAALGVLTGKGWTVTVNGP